MKSLEIESESEMGTQFWTQENEQKWAENDDFPNLCRFL